jgi:hypothetical protein
MSDLLLLLAAQAKVWTEQGLNEGARQVQNLPANTLKVIFVLEKQVEQLLSVVGTSAIDVATGNRNPKRPISPPRRSMRLMERINSAQDNSLLPEHGQEGEYEHQIEGVENTMDHETNDLMETNGEETHDMDESIEMTEEENDHANKNSDNATSTDADRLKELTNQLQMLRDQMARFTKEAEAKRKKSPQTTRTLSMTSPSSSSGQISAGSSPAPGAAIESTVASMPTPPTPPKLNSSIPPVAPAMSTKSILQNGHINNNKRSAAHLNLMEQIRSAKNRKFMKSASRPNSSFAGDEGHRTPLRTLQKERMNTKRQEVNEVVIKGQRKKLYCRNIPGTDNLAHGDMLKLSAHIPLNKTENPRSPGGTPMRSKDTNRSQQVPEFNSVHIFRRPSARMMNARDSMGGKENEDDWDE